MELGALSLARLLSSTVGITDFVAVVWSDYHGKAREEICNIIAYHLSRRAAGQAEWGC